MTSVIQDRNAQRARQHLSRRESFLLYRRPGYAPRLTCEASVTRFGEPYGRRILLDGTTAAPYYELPSSTPRRYYIDRVTQLIGELGQRGHAKTVISRVIAGQTPGIDWVDAADKLWAEYPQTFGFLFYSPKTGGWIGATPEKLLCTISPATISTVALAGTLPIAEQWNRKNYEEQQMVAEYIRSVFDSLRIPYTEHGPRDINFGAIKHLCSHFSAHVDNPDQTYETLIDRLSPTPALGGLPRDKALADINRIELHRRSCYGGYITVPTGSGTESYVTLRCAQFDPADGRWAIYTGGGITPHSDAESEWSETEAKAAMLKQILQ